MDYGWFDQGGIARERGHLGDGAEALLDQLGPTAAVGVVELAHALRARLLELWKRGPLEQELAAERGKEILAGELEGLRVIALERIAQHVV